MLSRFYLKKLIVKVLVKTQGTHFNPLLLLDPLLIQVLNIIVDQVLLVLLLQVMMAQEKKTNGGSDIGNDGEDIADPQQSQFLLSSFTGEDDFTHATQDENHGSRRADSGIETIGKPYRGRQRRMTPCNEDSFSASFESMSMELNTMIHRMRATYFLLIE